MAAPSSSAPAAAAAVAEASSDGPVLNLLTKRLRALRKKLNRIAQMEDALAQGKQLNPEQSEVLRSKPAVLALVDELDKLRAPLAAAVADEIALHTSPPPPTQPPAAAAAAPPLEDLVGLLYFSRLFDVQTQADFTATTLTRTHERGCCLTYDYVTDDSVELLGERDLDEISALGALVTSRPKAAAVSHRSALRECVEHARRWLENADQPVHADSPVTYAALREKLGKIMASDYCTATPEMKAPDDVAAAVGMYNSGLQVQVTEVAEVTDAEVPVDDSVASSEQKEDAEDNLQETELAPAQSSESSQVAQSSESSQVAQSSESSQVEDELPKDEYDASNHAGDIISDQQEQQTLEVDQEQNLRETESKEQQYLPRRAYQNTRGGNRGGGGFGGRRGYPNGRGGRGGRGGIYQNGRSQNYDAGYNQRGYYNPRGRGGGGRFGGPGMANNYGPATQGPVPSYVE